MALLDLWNNSPDQLLGKQVQQLIAFSGAGKLLDGSDCSQEFRSFLSTVPSGNLREYADQCLMSSFSDSGFALQDVVNEIGVRIGAEVTPGRYRGKQNSIGFDGLWRFENGNSIIIEVKTTDAYRIDLNIVANYRKQLIKESIVLENSSSMLLIVGRQDTGDLEAQIRGSRHAWDLRIISVDALLRLLSVKEQVEDPVIIQRIHNILIPREFTRLDEIAEIIFSASEEIKCDVVEEDIEQCQNEEKKIRDKKFAPVSFHDACIPIIEKKLNIKLVKRSRSQFSSPNNEYSVTCAISKEHNSDTSPHYWFAFHPHQCEKLNKYSHSFVAFGCGSSSCILAIPFNEFQLWLNGMNMTKNEERSYWHVVIGKEQDKFILYRKKGETNIDLTQYLVA